ncbi:MAG TPA: hypothetical protein VE977_15405, partial [Pyrinomonadaceae bacterium]|nr:hypothetical protein [Pyrinomonadaceae bacterium]
MPLPRTSFQFARVLSENNGITYAKSFDSGHDSAVAGWLSLGCRFPVGDKERGKQPAAATKPDNTQTGLIELRYLGSCVFCHIRVLAMGNSIKEAISTMKPKQIFKSILAVLFVFPLMGTF